MERVIPGQAKVLTGNARIVTGRGVSPRVLDRKNALPGPHGRQFPHVEVVTDRMAQQDEEARTRRTVEGQILALTVMGAERDANHHQRLALKKHLPRLLRQYRHTGDYRPALKEVRRIMFTAWAPSDPEIRGMIEKLAATL